jgi:hypothetical protein
MILILFFIDAFKAGNQSFMIYVDIILKFLVVTFFFLKDQNINIQKMVVIKTLNGP